ncbi:imidazolonepropionase-like domain-containing protein [Streptomyces sp. NPDC087903]|uniref:imidazolonepropionase-like domain-containing protein n=1 Tax=Streptomyces sp. NPDC087903 TaxID=3365819 RepID=UPI00381D4EF9
MLTIHAADLLVTGDRRPAVPGGAVLVDGRRLAALGPYDELAAAHPAARVRRWPGLLTPGLVNPYGPELLEHAYHPDPREADELGTAPLFTGEALAALGMTDARRAASARRGVQRMLAHGTVAVAGDLRRPAVRDAVHRAGLSTRPRLDVPVGPPTLDPLAAGRSLAEAILLPLPPVGTDGLDATVGTDVERALGTDVDGTAERSVEGAAERSVEGTFDATFAVFDVPDEAALGDRGAASCVATVVAGRLLHRRR